MLLRKGGAKALPFLIGCASQAVLLNLAEVGCARETIARNYAGSE